MKEFKYTLKHKAKACNEGHEEHLVYGDTVSTVIAPNEQEAIRRAKADIPKALANCYNAIDVNIISIGDVPT